MKVATRSPGGAGRVCGPTESLRKEAESFQRLIAEYVKTHGLVIKP